MWHGTWWHRKVWKIILHEMHNIFLRISEDDCDLSWQNQQFGCVHFHVALQGNTLDVSCCVIFFESHCHGCFTSWQHANFAADVAFCDLVMTIVGSHETSLLRWQISHSWRKFVKKNHFGIANCENFRMSRTKLRKLSGALQCRNSFYCTASRATV